MATDSRDARFAAAEAALGYSFDGPILIGGNYVPVIRDGSTVYVSGQVPRVGTQVVVTGRVGEAVSLADAQKAAQVCAMRALALLRQEAGSLDRIRRLLKVNVFTQCAPGFTQLSEVADGASDLLQRILGDTGVHARTSVGVYALPKDASVELDLVAMVD